MPGMDGLEFCRELKSNRETRDIAVVLLSGSEGGSRVAADAAGAEAFVPKPFSPLELLAVVERLSGGLYGVPFRATKKSGSQEEQLLLYARDLRHLLQIERAQRSLVQEAYRQTVAAFASALESKDTRTRAHSERVQRYALELARTMDSELADDPSAEYGFLLARRRQDRDPGPRAAEARTAHRAGAGADADAHDPRRADARGVALLAGARRAHRALAPRALGRRRLPGRARARGDPDRSADLRGGRHPRRDDERPRVSRGASAGRTRTTRSSRSPDVSSTPTSSTRSARASRPCARCAGSSTPPL